MKKKLTSGEVENHFKTLFAGHVFRVGDQVYATGTWGGGTHEYHMRFNLEVCTTAHVTRPLKSSWWPISFLMCNLDGGTSPFVRGQLRVAEDTGAMTLSVDMPEDAFSHLSAQRDLALTYTQVTTPEQFLVVLKFHFLMGMKELHSLYDAELERIRGEVEAKKQSMKTLEDLMEHLIPR